MNIDGVVCSIVNEAWITTLIKEGELPPFGAQYSGWV